MQSADRSLGRPISACGIPCLARASAPDRNGLPRGAVRVAPFSENTNAGNNRRSGPGAGAGNPIRTARSACVAAIRNHPGCRNKDNGTRGKIAARNRGWKKRTSSSPQAPRQTKHPMLYCNPGLRERFRVAPRKTTIARSRQTDAGTRVWAVLVFRQRCVLTCAVAAGFGYIWRVNRLRGSP